MMIPCQISTFLEFIYTAFQFEIFQNETNMKFYWFIINIVQSSLKVRYSDLVDFSDKISYINLFYIIYGLKDMNFQSFSNFQNFAHGKGFFAVSFSENTRQRLHCRVQNFENY